MLKKKKKWRSRICPLCIPWLTVPAQSPSTEKLTWKPQMIGKKSSCRWSLPCASQQRRKANCFLAGAGKVIPKGCFLWAVWWRECGHGWPGGPTRSGSRAVQFLILALTQRLKRAFQVFWAWLPSLMVFISLQAPFISLHPSLAAGDFCPTGISLLFSQFVWPWLHTGSLQGHPSLLVTDRKDQGAWPSWPLLKIMLSQPQLFLSTSAGGRK